MPFKNKKSINLGLIGGGYWGKNLIREFNNLGVLKAICEISPDLQKVYHENYPKVKITSKWDKILSDKSITAVCVSLPAEMHYKFAKEALEADKDVFVEKPITLSTEEAQELIDIAKSRKRILMVGHLLHYHPCVIKIKELIASGKIGKIKNIVSNRLNLGKFRTSENVLWSFAPHDISVILSLCKDQLPDEVICTGKDVLTKGIPDITNTVLKYRGQDVYVNINVNWLNPYKEQKLVVIGEKGMILFDDVKKDNKLEFYPDYLKWADTLPTYPEPLKNPPEYLEYDMSKTPLEKECIHFIEACKTRSKPLTDGEEGLRVLQVLQKAQECLERGYEINKEEDKKTCMESIKLSQDPKTGLIKAPEGYYYHPTATIDPDAEIGEGTKIWHYSHVCSGARIGKGCNLGQNVFVAGGSTLGDYCKIQNNVSVYAGVHCEDYVFLGPSCVLTNDLNPRAQFSKGGKYLETYIEEGVTIGANATIVCGHRLGHHSLIGAGAVVTKDVEPNVVMVGNPAVKIKTITENGIIN